MKKNILICGSGSTYTLPMIKTLMEHYSDFPIKEIKLYDIDNERGRLIYEAAKVLVDTYGYGVKTTFSINDKDVFGDIDFAFLQIRSGGLDMREKDEKIPLKYGCVGQETCGAGGFAYGLRSVPEVISLIKGIRKYSGEDTWIINYSNPAAIVAEATNRIFPSDKRIINLCDMPIAMMDGFAEFLETTRQQLSPRYFGLNHFGWFTHLYNEKGVDVLPKIKAQLKNGILMPEELMKDSDWKDTFNQLSKMVSDLDEYVPNTYMQYYLYPEEMVNHSNPDYTRANIVKDGRLNTVIEQCEYLIKYKKIEGSGLEVGVHGTYIVELATSLSKNQPRIFITMVKNNGIIANVDMNATVEVPCLISSIGVEPLNVGIIPTFYKSLIENQYGYEKLAVDAVLNEDYQSALKALVLNRTIVNVPIAKTILDELSEANKDYWKLRKGDK